MKEKFGYLRRNGEIIWMISYDDGKNWKEINPSKEQKINSELTELEVKYVEYLPIIHDALKFAEIQAKETIEAVKKINQHF